MGAGARQRAPSSQRWDSCPQLGHCAHLHLVSTKTIYLHFSFGTRNAIFHMVLQLLLSGPGCSRRSPRPGNLPATPFTCLHPPHSLRLGAQAPITDSYLLHPQLPEDRSPLVTRSPPPQAKGLLKGDFLPAGSLAPGSPGSVS